MELTLFTSPLMYYSMLLLLLLLLLLLEGPTTVARAEDLGNNSESSQLYFEDQIWVIQITLVTYKGTMNPCVVNYELVSEDMNPYAIQLALQALKSNFGPYELFGAGEDVDNNTATEVVVAAAANRKLQSSREFNSHHRRLLNLCPKNCNGVNRARCVALNCFRSKRRRRRRRRELQQEEEEVRQCYTFDLRKAILDCKGAMNDVETACDVDLLVNIATLEGINEASPPPSPALPSDFPTVLPDEFFDSPSGSHTIEPTPCPTRGQTEIAKCPNIQDRLGFLSIAPSTTLFPTATFSHTREPQSCSSSSSSPTTDEPTASFVPSVLPTIQPTELKTTDDAPSNHPTPASSSSSPSSVPTSITSEPPYIRQPTVQPSRQPTVQPSRQPSVQPSQQPSVHPSQQPSRQPSVQPSRQPTVQPSRQPSVQPTLHPFYQPTDSPILTDSPTSPSRPSPSPSLSLSVQPSFLPSTGFVPSSVPFTCAPYVVQSCAPSLFPSSAPSSCQTIDQPCDASNGAANSICCPNLFCYSNSTLPMTTTNSTTTTTPPPKTPIPGLCKECGVAGDACGAGDGAQCCKNDTTVGRFTCRDWKCVTCKARDKKCKRKTDCCSNLCDKKTKKCTCPPSPVAAAVATLRQLAADKRGKNKKKMKKMMNMKSDTECYY